MSRVNEEDVLTKKSFNYVYPRRRFFRWFSRGLMRLIVPLFFKLEINGKENFPKSGPLLVVGNHVAVMEAVLMTIYSPWQVELLGNADIPNERWTDFVIKAYGFIPIKRGHADRGALRNALGVLQQKGVIGLFPEGGTWAAGRMRPQTGVAWLSYQGKAPVLPIGFGGLAGALNQALRLKRPKLVMNIGRLIPAVEIPEVRLRKELLETYSLDVLDAITNLVPLDERRRNTVLDEQFELTVHVRGHDGQWKEPEGHAAIQNQSGLSRFLHSPVILKVYWVNLKRDVRALQAIAQTRDPQHIIDAAALVLDYLENENPYFLTYRFGGPEASKMQNGVEELLAFAQWAKHEGLEVNIVPIRRYYSVDEEKEIVQTEQDKYRNWM